MTLGLHVVGSADEAPASYEFLDHLRIRSASVVAPLLGRVMVASAHIPDPLPALDFGCRWKGWLEQVPHSLLLRYVAEEHVSGTMTEHFVDSNIVGSLRRR